MDVVLGPTEEGAGESLPLSTASYPGIEIEYRVEPKRHYLLNGVEVPSVTTVLECLDKPALPWWGMTVGAEGAAALFNMGLLFPVTVERGDHVYTVVGCMHPESGQPMVAGKEDIVALLSAHKLTTNHVKETAGKRGQSCHDALEVWSKTGVLPEVGMFPPNETGYVEALTAFLKTVEPEVLETEVMVASKEHGFAGRFDNRIRVTRACQVVAHHTPKKGPQYETLEPGVYIVDLKTSKSVYYSHAKQLAAYEVASQECGFDPSDGRYVIHADADGNYRFVRTDVWATPEDFLTTLAEYNSQADMKKRKPKGGAS